MNHHLNYFLNQKEKQQNTRLANECFLMNQSLKRFIQQVRGEIDREKYQKEARKANQQLVQCTIWDVQWRNNMENPKIVVEQALLLLTILQREEGLPNKDHLKYHISQVMVGLQRVDTALYNTYLQQARRLAC